MNALCAAFLLLGATSCVSTEQKREMPDADRGQFTLYMNGPDRASLDITFRLESLNITAEDGTQREVPLEPVTISSLQMVRRQKSLAETYLPAGKYKSMRLIVTEASVKREGGKADLALPEGGIEIPITAEVERGQNTTLFLLWEPDASISEGFMFSPALAVKGESPGLPDLLVFVSNENSDNVSVINRQSGEVVATVKTGRGPRGIATSISEENQRVYVANSGSASISVIDPDTNRAETEIPIRFGREPEGIAVAELEDGGDLIFLSNYGSDNVSLVDAGTFEEIESIRVGDGPIAVATDPPLVDFLVSVSLSPDDVNVLRSYRESFFNVYVANMDSRNVSVLKVDKRTGKVEDVMTVAVDWGPIGLSVDTERARVYVANYNSDKLSVIDIVKLAKNNVAGSVSTISNIGTSVVGVIADSSPDRLYILKEEGDIMLISPSAELLGPEGLALTPIIGSVYAGRAPRSFLMDPERSRLYVVDRGSDSVSVIDKTTRKLGKVIPVGRRPYGIAMFPEM
jgi:YVTN family beta-propeller protein